MTDDLVDRLRHQVERATDPIDPREVGASIRRHRRARTLNIAAVTGLVALVVGVVAMRSDQGEPQPPASVPVSGDPGLAVERIVAPEEPDGTQVVLIEFDGELPAGGVAYVDDIRSVDAPGLAYTMQDMTETVWVCEDRHSGFGPGAVGDHSIDVLVPADWLDLASEPVPERATVPLAPASDGVSGSWSGKILGCGPYRGYVQYSIWASADRDSVRVTVDGDTIRVVVQAPEAGTTTAVVTSSTTTSTEADRDPDDVAARAFVDAWGRADTETMRELAGDSPYDLVDGAIASGTAVGEPDCSSQPSGQYQCIVNIRDGGQMYLLIGEPGAPSGRVWYLAPYHPDS